MTKNVPPNFKTIPTVYS